MALDNFIYVDQKALHRPSAIRLLSYGLTTGVQGVLGAPDCAVKQLGTPGNQVQVMPGAMNILARHLGGAYESYAGKIRVAETSQPISPTTSSGSRSDLVILRVENPYVSGAGSWEEPADPVEGPYAFVRVIEGVPNTTYDVRQLTSIGGDTWSAITLARIDRGPSTNVVTQANVRDLRSLAALGGTRTVYVENPVVEPPPIAQSSYTEFHDSEADPDYNPVGPGGADDVHDYLTAYNTAWQNWPDAATWQVPVPAWATSMDVECQVFGAQILDGDIYGNMQMRIGSSTSTLSTVALDYVQVPARHNLAYGTTMTVGSALRGRIVTFRLQVKHAYPGPGRLDAKGGTTSKLAVNFQRYPDPT